MQHDMDVKVINRVCCRFTCDKRWPEDFSAAYLWEPGDVRVTLRLYSNFMSEAAILKA